MTGHVDRTPMHAALFMGALAFGISDKGALRDIPLSKFVTTYVLSWLAANQFKNEKEQSSGIRGMVREIVTGIAEDPLSFFVMGASFFMLYKTKSPCN